MVLSRSESLRTMHLFAGAGGGILADLLLRHTPVCAVEIEEYPRKVLLARQRDGILPWFPIWDDIKTFDGKPWRGEIDIVAGGFPCQDISCAGKGEGITGKRSGLWGEMSRVVREVGPRYVFVENSPMLTSRGLGTILGDLATMGYHARWGVFSCGEIGLDHERERIFIYAHNHKNGDRGYRSENINLGKRIYRKDFSQWQDRLCELGVMDVVSFCGTYPEGRRIFYGLDYGLDRIAAIGNGQSPQVAALAWRILSGIE